MNGARPKSKIPIEGKVDLRRKKIVYEYKSIWHTLERASPGADLLLSPQPDASLTARFVKTGPVPLQMHQFTSQLQMKPVPNYTAMVDRGRPLNKEPVSCDSRSAAFNETIKVQR